MARARKMHTYGIAPAVTREGSSLHVPSFDDAGFNYRMSDVQAAIMRVQLERLPELMAAREAAARGYAQRLDGVDGVTLPVVLPDRTHPWQSYLVTTDEGIDRDAVVVALRERGVGSNFGTYASHVQPVYASTQECPNSRFLFDRQLALPMHSNLVEDDLDHVADQLREVLKSPEARPER
jgi:dTDP-4-amino-4,6-dideoxygalactose transaminase